MPTFAGRPIVGYSWIVLAAVGTGFLSFGLWVHHMYTTGLPRMSLSFFAAASTAIAIPMGVQVFAWIATMAAGRMRFSTPGLFAVGGMGHVKARLAEVLHHHLGQAAVVFNHQQGGSHAFQCSGHRRSRHRVSLV